MLIETTIASSYVQDWGTFEGIREIIQNALDSGEQGHKMNISYVRKERMLVVSSDGARLKKGNLLLGSTSKCNDRNQRGQYGEGFKIGSLALIREGKTIVICSGTERWEALIKYSKQFDSDVLCFKIIKAPVSSKLYFMIGNIEPKEWRDLKINFLNLYLPESKLTRKTPHGIVFKDKKLKGRMYCGGIFVAYNKRFEFGYDFRPEVLSLNRDRNMVSDWDLSWNTSKIWAYISANSKGELYNTKSMLKENVIDVEHISNFADYKVKGAIAEDFLKEHGDKAFPVDSEEEASQVRSLGYKPVYSSSSYTGFIRSELGDIDVLRKTVELDYSLFQEISSTDSANLQWVFELIFFIDPKYSFDIHIAKFNLDNTRSLSDGKLLVINSNLLISKYEILQEAIRHYAGEKDISEIIIWKQLLQKTIVANENT